MLWAGEVIQVSIDPRLLVEELSGSWKLEPIARSSQGIQLTRTKPGVRSKYGVERLDNVLAGLHDLLVTGKRHDGYNW